MVTLIRAVCWSSRDESLIRVGEEKTDMPSMHGTSKDFCSWKKKSDGWQLKMKGEVNQKKFLFFEDGRSTSMFVCWWNNPIEINQLSKQRRNNNTKLMLQERGENCWDNILELMRERSITSRG